MTTKFLLQESELPTHWYNVVADLPSPPPPPLGADGKPATLDALAAIFPPGLIEQEVSAERWIAIPDEVREIFKLWRPSPLYRAHRLEAGAEDPGPYLLQERVGQPDRFAQAEHLDSTGLVQQAGRYPAPGDRDRCGSVGLLAGTGRPAAGPGDTRLYGQGQL